LRRSFCTDGCAGQGQEGQCQGGRRMTEQAFCRYAGRKAVGDGMGERPGRETAVAEVIIMKEEQRGAAAGCEIAQFTELIVICRLHILFFLLD